jgi:hypothetical protein
MWCLRRRSGEGTIACTLEERSDSACSLAVTLDGSEIAAGHYLTRVDAVSHAGILLECLEAGGWTPVAAMPAVVVH